MARHSDGDRSVHRQVAPALQRPAIASALQGLRRRTVCRTGPVHHPADRSPRHPRQPAAQPLLFDSLASVGGAEVDVSVLFTDIRGSTGLAEKVGAARFRQLFCSPYYAKASAAIEASDGIVDKLLGDGVMALFIR